MWPQISLPSPSLIHYHFQTLGLEAHPCEKKSQSRHGTLGIWVWYGAQKECSKTARWRNETKRGSKDLDVPIERTLRNLKQQPILLRWECRALGGHRAGVQAPRSHKRWFPGLVGKHWCWLRDHRSQLTWIIMALHPLVLRLQWPWDQVFLKLHFCVCLLLQRLHKALFLLPVSWMLAGITGDTQTPVSGGEDTRPDVTFVATSNPATCSCPPPSWSLLAFLSRQRSSWTPDSNPFQLYGMERWLRMSLPELSRNQVLWSSLWQLSQSRASWAQYTPRTEGQSPVLLFSN